MELLVTKEVEKFIEILEKSAVSKTLQTIDLLQEFTFRLGMPHSKKVSADLYELRIRGRQEIRIFYTFKDEKIVLLHGFIKKTNQTPPKEITTALKRIPWQT